MVITVRAYILVMHSYRNGYTIGQHGPGHPAMAYINFQRTHQPWFRVLRRTLRASATACNEWIIKPTDITLAYMHNKEV